eukprot:Clim_evm3s207 gene=Clim_evmTU3s207
MGLTQQPTYEVDGHVVRNTERERVRALVKKEALKRCEEYVIPYMDCRKGKFVSLIWECHSELDKLNQCLHSWTTEEVMEKRLKDYVRDREEKIAKGEHLVLEETTKKKGGL